MQTHLRQRAAFLVVTVFIFVGAAQASPPAATRPTTNASEEVLDFTAVTDPAGSARLDVPYVSQATAQQALDIYWPAKGKAAAAVIYVHGGEWAKGDKGNVAFKPRFLTRHGVALVSINYRLSDKAQHPAQVTDIAAAIRWVGVHGGELGIDSKRIYLMGHSAGCHLVLLTALDPRPLAGVGLKPSDLAGVISWSGGAFDLVEKVKQGGLYAKCIRINFSADARVWRDASPINHVTDCKPLPPILLISAEKDSADSIAANKRLRDRIAAAGGRVQWMLLGGKSHGTADHDLGKPGDSSGEILLRFLGR